MPSGGRRSQLRAATEADLNRAIRDQRILHRAEVAITAQRGTVVLRGSVGRAISIECREDRAVGAGRRAA